MASIKLKFRTSSVQEKEGRLYYQVIHNRVARQIHTEYRIYSSEWDADHSNIILPTSVTPQRQAYLLSLKDTLDADQPFDGQEPSWLATMARNGRQSD